MKSMLMFVFACVAACAAQASYLYWEIDPEDKGLADVVAWESECGLDWNRATVYAVSSSGKQSVETIDFGDDAGGWSGEMNTDLSALGDDLSGYSFYIEVANYDDDTYTLLGTSKTASYSTLSSGKYIGAGEMSEVPGAQIWHGTFTAAPEPTGALLMLIGVGVLGLRRRERKAA